MDRSLFEIIVCPVCHGKLEYKEHGPFLLCRFDRLSYAVKDGIPVLVQEEATQLTLEEVEKLT